MLVSTAQLIERGYTGHEHLTEIGLINMNARLYDPAIGRFLSPDNYVQMPDVAQNYNRYAYCMNNPMMYNDPSGNVFLIDDLICIGIFLGANAIMGGYFWGAQPDGSFDWGKAAQGAFATVCVQGATIASFALPLAIPGAWSAFGTALAQGGSAFASTAVNSLGMSYMTTGSFDIDWSAAAIAGGMAFGFSMLSSLDAMQKGGTRDYVFDQDAQQYKLTAGGDMVVPNGTYQKPIMGAYNEIGGVTVGFSMPKGGSGSAFSTTIVNLSTKPAFVKPETNNPRYTGASWRIPPRASRNYNIDGIATSLHRDQVYKIGDSPLGYTVTVNPDGTISTPWYISGEWKTFNQLGSPANWENLFRSAETGSFNMTEWWNRPSWWGH